MDDAALASKNAGGRRERRRAVPHCAPPAACAVSTSPSSSSEASTSIFAAADRALLRASRDDDRAATFAGDATSRRGGARGMTGFRPSGRVPPPLQEFGGGVMGVSTDPRRRFAGRVEAEADVLVAGAVEAAEAAEVGLFFFPVAFPFAVPFPFPFPFPHSFAKIASGGTRIRVPSIILAFGRNPDILPRLSRITSAVATWNRCAIRSTVSSSTAEMEEAGESILPITRHFVLDAAKASSLPAASLHSGMQREVGGEHRAGDAGQRGAGGAREQARV